MPSTLVSAVPANNRLTTLVLAGALALAAAMTVPVPIHAQSGDLTTVTDDNGTYLVDGAGLTLYYFNPDPPGASVCEGDCLDAWPPLLSDGELPTADESVTGTIASLTRADGTSQVTYRGRLLYYFAGDQAAGDTNGQGLGDVWWVAAEDGSLADAVAPESPELVLEAVETDLGTFITGADGLTAYYFTVDTAPGISLCADDCLAAWPPVTVSEGGGVGAGEGVTGVIGLITATDGSPQVTYDGRPLYYFAGDQAAGDVNGQNVGGVWFVATTDGLLHTG